MPQSYGYRNKNKNYIDDAVTKLVPSKNVNIHKDEDYIFASLGVLSLTYKAEVKSIFRK